MFFKRKNKPTLLEPVKDMEIVLEDIPNEPPYVDSSSSAPSLVSLTDELEYETTIEERIEKMLYPSTTIVKGLGKYSVSGNTATQQSKTMQVLNTLLSDVNALIDDPAQRLRAKLAERISVHARPPHLKTPGNESSNSVSSSVSESIFPNEKKYSDSKSIQTEPSNSISDVKSIQTVPSNSIADVKSIQTEPSNLIADAKSIQTEPNSIADVKLTQTDPSKLIADVKSIQTEPSNSIADVKSIQTDPSSLIADVKLTQTDPSNLMADVKSIKTEIEDTISTVRTNPINSVDINRDYKRISVQELINDQKRASLDLMEHNKGFHALDTVHRTNSGNCSPLSRVCRIDGARIQ